jgi:alpha-L-rhamnosidase
MLDAHQGDLWDSGRIESGRCIHVEYQGSDLSSHRRCYWKVQTWDQEGISSPWSKIAWWEMGLLEAADWQGAWIGLATAERLDKERSCACLRKCFDLGASPKRARIHASALGFYTLYINGKRVGLDHFTPGWTDYRMRIQYQTYDVTWMLRRGENVISALVGDGWYCGHIGMAGNKYYGNDPRLIAQLEIEGPRGASQVLATDGTWKAAEGPIVASDLLMGELYDARREMPGWNDIGFDDSQWAVPAVMERSDVPLVAQQGPTVRKQVELVPVAVMEPSPGCHIFDLGQNTVGWARLKVKGPKGCMVTLRFGELLNPDGTLYTANLRGAKCTDVYILKGGELETFEPCFTYHGFRYVEVTGFPGIPGKDAITGIVVHSDTPTAGSFECSSPMLNRLQQNILWGQRGNFLEVPTDCPQRDERLGWTGDAQIFMRTAGFNMDVSTFFEKWLIDLADGQQPDGAFTHVAPAVIPGAGSAGWGDAGVICPWILYLCYGDTRMLKRLYPAMARWIAYQKKDSESLVRPLAGFGDWVAVNADTPKDLIATAYFAHTTRLMARIAKVLKKSKDAQKYVQLFKKIKEAFNREFVTPGTRIAGDTQTAYVLALAFDLLPASKRKEAAGRLVKKIEERNFHPSTGFLGAGYLLPVLADTGHLDVAYRLLLSDTYPSWGYMIRQGATTIWERWDGWTEEKGLQDPNMNSFNHYAFGSVGEWLYRYVAGIDLDPEEPAYRHISIHPRPGGGLTHVKAGYLSMHGLIVSEWKQRKERFDLKVEIPPNTRATIYLPAQSLDRVKESGKPLGKAEGILDAKMAGKEAVLSVGSGRYRFSV